MLIVRSILPNSEGLRNPKIAEPLLKGLAVRLIPEA